MDADTAVLTVTEKAARKARIAALSAKYRDEALYVTEPFRPDEPKTREMADRLKSMDLADRKVLWLLSSR